MGTATYVQNGILVALAKLNPQHPGFNADERVREHLLAIRPYLESWVLPALEAASGREDYRWARESVASDAARIRIKMRAAMATTEEG